MILEIIALRAALALARRALCTHHLPACREDRSVDRAVQRIVDCTWQIEQALLDLDLELASHELKPF